MSLTSLVHYYLKKITTDNSCFFKIWIIHLYVKDQRSWEILLGGQSRGKLHKLLVNQLNHKIYTAISLPKSANISKVSTPLDRHTRLGHPQNHIVSSLVNCNHVNIFKVDSFFSIRQCATC